MSKLSLIVLLVSGLFLFLGVTLSKAAETAKNIHSFTMTDINGQDVPLEQYKGKIVLLLNVASKCGLTPQYKGLQDLYTKYKDKGFVILGFPANNFKEQEPASNAEIKEFCALNYKVEFPLFAKISVLGADIHPLYQFLTSEETNPGFSGPIRWNFDKFLVDRNGKILARFHPKTTPEDAELIQAIEKALKTE